MLSTYQFICFFVYLFIYVFIHSFVYILIYVFIHLIVCLCILSLIHPFIYFHRATLYLFCHWDRLGALTGRRGLKHHPLQKHSAFAVLVRLAQRKGTVDRLASRPDITAGLSVGRSNLLITVTDRAGHLASLCPAF